MQHWIFRLLASVEQAERWRASNRGTSWVPAGGEQWEGVSKSWSFLVNSCLYNRGRVCDWGRRGRGWWKVG